VKELRLRRKALIALAVVALLIVATSPFTTVLLIREEARQIVDDSMMGLVTSGHANLNGAEGFLGVSLALVTTNRAELQRHITQITDLAADTDRQLKAYESAITTPSERQKFDRVIETRKAYVETRRHVLDLLEKEKRDEAENLFNTEGLTRFKAYLESFNGLVESCNAEARQRGSSILHLCTVVLIAQGVLTVFFLIYAFFVPLLTLLERTVAKDGPKDI
jgi:hypothetical protein